MTSFFRFPHTPHLAWLGTDTPRDDKVLTAAEASAMLSDNVVVEEKLDGANLGISVDESGKLRLQNRGQYLIPPFRGQFSRAAAWIERHQEELAPALGETLLLFGEWCAARHSVFYDHLPDWFVAFDIYDRGTMRFWSTKRRDTWASKFDLPVVPTISRGQTRLAELTALVRSEPSRFGAARLEGVIVRRESKDFLQSRAKLVRPDFTQGIEEHWRSRQIEWNAVSGAARRNPAAVSRGDASRA